ncbi:eukaryotic initiation factor 4A-15-like [Quercus lobata]|uniref:eukaryotic initiation factor 4A-15-like n=1 Tax=Quercus lobata TaxID=97700 RepID=UPI0012443939|nr:eukaryotic initiation factor 4A-15-like [Quercus lobata]
MAGAAPEGSQFDARQFDAKMNELLSTDGQQFFTSYDEVYESFDSMGLHENLLRGIYAYGRNITNRTEKNKSKVITTGGSFGAAEGRRKQTKGKSKNKE